MTLINLLGWIFLLSPFVLFFAVAIKMSGLVDAIMIYVGVLLLVVVLYVGATLAGFK
jgi:hypothetical protein